MRSPLNSTWKIAPFSGKFSELFLINSLIDLTFACDSELKTAGSLLRRQNALRPLIAPNVLHANCHLTFYRALALNSNLNLKFKGKRASVKPWIHLITYSFLAKHEIPSSTTLRKNLRKGSISAFHALYRKRLVSSNYRAILFRHYLLAVRGFRHNSPTKAAIFFDFFDFSLRFQINKIRPIFSTLSQFKLNILNNLLQLKEFYWQYPFTVFNPWVSLIRVRGKRRHKPLRRFYLRSIALGEVKRPSFSFSKFFGISSNRPRYTPSLAFFKKKRKLSPAVKVAPAAYTPYEVLICAFVIVEFCQTFELPRTWCELHYERFIKNSVRLKSLNFDVEELDVCGSKLSDSTTFSHKPAYRESTKGREGALSFFNKLKEKPVSILFNNVSLRTFIGRFAKPKFEKKSQPADVKSDTPFKKITKNIEDLMTRDPDKYQDFFLDPYLASSEKKKLKRRKIRKPKFWGGLKVFTSKVRMSFLNFFKFSARFTLTPFLNTPWSNKSFKKRIPVIVELLNSERSFLLKTKNNKTYSGVMAKDFTLNSNLFSYNNFVRPYFLSVYLLYTFLIKRNSYQIPDFKLGSLAVRFTSKVGFRKAIDRSPQLLWIFFIWFKINYFYRYARDIPLRFVLVYVPYYLSVASFIAIAFFIPWFTIFMFLLLIFAQQLYISLSCLRFVLRNCRYLPTIVHQVYTSALFYLPIFAWNSEQSSNSTLSYHDFSGQNYSKDTLPYYCYPQWHYDFCLLCLTVGQTNFFLTIGYLCSNFLEFYSFISQTRIWHFLSIIVELVIALLSPLIPILWHVSARFFSFFHQILLFSYYRILLLFKCLWVNYRELCYILISLDLNDVFVWGIPIAQAFIRKYHNVSFTTLMLCKSVWNFFYEPVDLYLRYLFVIVFCWTFFIALFAVLDSLWVPTLVAIFYIYLIWRGKLNSRAYKPTSAPLVTFFTQMYLDDRRFFAKRSFFAVYNWFFFKTCYLGLRLIAFTLFLVFFSAMRVYVYASFFYCYTVNLTALLFKFFLKLLLVFRSKRSVYTVQPFQRRLNYTSFLETTLFRQRWFYFVFNSLVIYLRRMPNFLNYLRFSINRFVLTYGNLSNFFWLQQDIVFNLFGQIGWWYNNLENFFSVRKSFYQNLYSLNYFDRINYLIGFNNLVGDSSSSLQLTFTRKGFSSFAFNISNFLLKRFYITPQIYLDVINRFFSKTPNKIFFKEVFSLFPETFGLDYAIRMSTNSVRFFNTDFFWLSSTIFNFFVLPKVKVYTLFFLIFKISIFICALIIKFCFIIALCAFFRCFKF